MPVPKSHPIRVTQDPEKPIAKDVLAEAIVKISKAATELRASGINEHGVIVLLAHETKLGRTTIKMVLNALGELRRLYCRG